jgi:hypothetical protein
MCVCGGFSADVSEFPSDRCKISYNCDFLTIITLPRLSFLNNVAKGPFEIEDEISFRRASVLVEVL